MRFDNEKPKQTKYFLLWNFYVYWIFVWTISWPCIVDEGVFYTLVIIVTPFLHLCYGLLNYFTNEFNVIQCLICWYSRKPKTIIIVLLVIALDKDDNSHLCKWIILRDCFATQKRFCQHYACKGSIKNFSSI